MQNNSKSAVIVLSGGLDSTVLLAHYIALGWQVKAITIDYGQRHSREIESAKAVSQYYGVEHRVADLRSLLQFMGGSSQTDPAVEVPHGHYAEENMKLTVVPNRNMILLAVAGAWAISLKADEVAYAAHAGDHAIYPDCREEFVGPLATALQHADWHQVKLSRPFLAETKAGLVRLGSKLGVPFGLTYSCYEGKAEQCGLCGTCQERRSAFRDAGVPDPTRYNPAGLAALPNDKLKS